MAEKKYLNLEGLTDVAGHVNTRLKTVTTIPVSADDGAVRLYVGNTDSVYTKGHIYQYQSSNSLWVDITDFYNKTDVYNKTEIGTLNDLPDTNKNVVENIKQIKLSVDQLSASKLSISDIDNTLSNTSENPVQNKVIKLSIDALAGSILTKVDKVSGATNNDFATLDNNGNLTDSGISKDIVPNTATTSNKLATVNDIPTELNDLSDDVVITNPVNGQILVYNGTSGKFENQTGSAPIGGATFQGSILYANLPTTGMVNGDWYDIKDAFTTDNRFEEGSGISCAAGTDVIWVADDNKWNILTPSGVYSFNGRLGAVVPASGDYDASDVGLGNVINTGDSATPVSGGTTKFTTGGAYTELNKKADKVSSATNGNFAGLDANGNLTDSGKKASDFAGTGVVSKTANGLAPQLPNETTTTKFLRQDGSWEIPNYPSVPSAYTSNPAMDGTASAGSSTKWAKGDHVHPTDTSRASASDLTSHVNNTSNPHSVTKSQVGLGNVPNVTTNNQTPTFSQASSRANIASGEKLSTIFGKIMKYFADLKDLAFIAKDGTSSTKYLKGDGNWEAPTDFPSENSTTLFTSGGAYLNVPKRITLVTDTAYNNGDVIRIPKTSTAGEIRTNRKYLPICEVPLMYSDIDIHPGYLNITLSGSLASGKEIGVIIFP